MNTELLTKLEKLALKHSQPFCYSCYQVCPSGICPNCLSDDLMRVTKSGNEYGLAWIYEEIIQENLTPINIDEIFEESVRSSLENETIKCGWMSFDVITIMKEQDPISWDIAKNEFENSEENEGVIISFDNGRTYFWTHEVEKLVEDI